MSSSLNPNGDIEAPCRCRQSIVALSEVCLGFANAFETEYKVCENIAESNAKDYCNQHLINNDFDEK